MQFVFVDETNDRKFPDYLGLCVVTINSVFYPSLKVDAQKILHNIGWDPAVEFKGSYLFSASKGCPSVDIDTRIDAARGLLALNIAKHNSRIKFHFGTLSSTTHGQDYLDLLPGLVAKCLPKAPSGAGKNLVSVVCDNRSDVSQKELHDAMTEAVKIKGYVLFEELIMAKSTFDTVGLMYADLVGYLAGRVAVISNDAELFDDLTEAHLEENGKVKKLQSSRELIDRIKELNTYTYEDKPWRGA